MRINAALSPCIAPGKAVRQSVVDSPSLWLKVSNIKETMVRVSKAGGKEQEAKPKVPHGGWSSTFTDPDGTTIGIVQNLQLNLPPSQVMKFPL
jgi:predicted enzyme related to lactoylglutathione lyase